MKVIDKENNIVEDICPSCGKDGAIIQTTEYADGSKYIEVMCLNGCGHFARIIKRESELINEQIDNEEWIHTLNTEQLAEFLADKCNEVVETVLSDASCDIGDIDNDDYWYRRADFVEWLKQPHANKR